MNLRNKRRRTLASAPHMNNLANPGLIVLQLETQTDLCAT
jgi:hypothetical protein